MKDSGKADDKLRNHFTNKKLFLPLKSSGVAS